MKNIIVLLFLFTFSPIFAQEKYTSNFLTPIEWGVYGGLNSETFLEFGGTFIMEATTKISSNLNLKFSLGYYRLIKSDKYTVKTYSKPKVDTLISYFSMEYDVTKTNYDVFPLSIGLQYVLKREALSPYLLFELNYNLINMKSDKTGTIYTPYNSFDELPDEFKNAHTVKLPNESYGIILGMGTIYEITKKLNIDFRYSYKTDSKILNTHQVIVGISF